MRVRAVAATPSAPVVPCLLSALAVALVGGCAVGPDFKPPAAPPVKSYLPPDSTVPADTGGQEPQRWIEGMDIPGQWWTLFHSPALDELISRAFRANPSIEAAQAALREADESYAAQRGALLPAVQAGYSVERQRNAVGTLAPTLSSGETVFTLHTAQVNVSYLLDLFGGARRQAESLHAVADAQRYELAATYLTLASNVVAATIQLASIEAQLAATNDIVSSEREALDILKRQYELGSIPMTDVMAQEATLATTQATLPALARQLDQTQHALALLAGRFPGEQPPVRFELPIAGAVPASAAAPVTAPTDAQTLSLPRDLPLSVPALLVRQRPDVLAAEAQLHAATAAVGVAIANMLPQITLTATEGGASTELAQLLASGNTFWSGGASLTQTLFSGGTLLHRERAARAGLDQAGAQYRLVVLTAFANVADALTALRHDADAVEAGARAAHAAAESLTTIRHNVELGSTGYLALLNAQQTYQQAVLNLAQAQASRFADTAALFQALGGGWWNSAEPALEVVPRG
ncbi:MAG TPA: efflux transporter outer membrane subunit [Steroidobacteraceae bacterium]|nr:efflux transporter outer membrane subunit [Steroidobacteraceae bacterium]